MSSHWYLRHQDGTIYGPSDVLELKSWAMTGRIGPDDDVSQDQDIWNPAPLLPDLEMVWSIQVDDDLVFGPFNIYALIDIAEESHLSYSTDVVHISTDKRHSLGDVLLPLLFAERDKRADRAQGELVDDLKRERSQVESLEHQLRAQKEDLKELRSQLDIKIKEQTRLSEKGMADHQALLQEREAAAEQIQGMEDEMRMAADIFKAREKATDKLSARVKELDEKSCLAEQTIETLNGQIQELEALAQKEQTSAALFSNQLGEMNVQKEIDKEAQASQDARIEELEASLQKAGEELEEVLVSAEKKSAQDLEAKQAEFSAELEQLRSQVKESSALPDRVKTLEEEKASLKTEMADLHAKFETATASLEDFDVLKEEQAASGAELDHARAALELRDAEVARLRQGSSGRPVSLIQQAMEQRHTGPSDASGEFATDRPPQAIQSALSSIQRETLKDRKRKDQAVINYKRQRTASQNQTQTRLVKTKSALPSMRKK